MPLRIDKYSDSFDCFLYFEQLIRIFQLSVNIVIPNADFISVERLKEEMLRSNIFDLRGYCDNDIQMERQ